MKVAVVLFSGQSLVDRWFREGEEFEGILAAEVFKTAFLNDNPQYTDLIMIDGATGGTPMFGHSSGFIAISDGEFTPGPELLHAYDQIDDALRGETRVDFVGTVWGQGHGNTGQLGSDWETGAYNANEERYKQGLEWVLGKLEGYVTANHGDAFTKQTNDPQVFIQHIGRRTRDEGSSIDGLNDIKDIQTEVAASDPDYHLASEGYDLEMPDGTHPTPEAFHELATRMSHFISTGEQGPEVVGIEVFNKNGRGKVILAFDDSGSISSSDSRLNSDGRDFLQVIDDAIIDQGGFAQTESIGLVSARVRDNKIVFILDREIEGTSVTVSYGYAGVLSEAAVSERGDGDTDVEPIGVKVNNPASPGNKLFLPMVAFREQVNVVDGPGGLDIGTLNRGISAKDNFKGDGYILYTSDNLHSVFGDHYKANQATGFMAVYFENGKWYYFDGDQTHRFTPDSLKDAILVAAVDYKTDQVTMLAGENYQVDGVQAGYLAGTLSIVPNLWNGRFNAGEFDVLEGTLYPHIPGLVDLGELKRGISAKDSFTGKGYILYSEENLLELFGPDFSSYQATNFIAVYHDGEDWRYFQNESTHTFDPADLANAVLVASVDFDRDRVTMLDDENGYVHNIQAGYASGTFNIVPNVYNGEYNEGEFGIEAGTLVLKAKHAADTGNLGSGITARDNFSGDGYILYTTENLNDVYGDTFSSRQADQFMAVYRQGGDWFRFNNETIIEFNPDDLANAVLIAEVDFTADEVTMLKGENTTIGGVQAGYSRGNLKIVPNLWADETNPGEFGFEGGTLFLYSDDYLLT